MDFKGKCPNFCKIILKPLWNKLHILITWDVALFVKNYVLGCDTMYSRRCLPTFRVNTSPRVLIRSSRMSVASYKNARRQI